MTDAATDRQVPAFHDDAAASPAPLLLDARAAAAVCGVSRVLTSWRCTPADGFPCPSGWAGGSCGGRQNFATGLKRAARPATGGRRCGRR